MVSLHNSYPQFNFLQHKGYPTREHFALLQKHGPCEIHRFSYAPVKKAWEHFNAIKGGANSTSNGTSDSAGSDNTTSTTRVGKRGKKSKVPNEESSNNISASTTRKRKSNIEETNTSDSNNNNDDVAINSKRRKSSLNNADSIGARTTTSARGLRNEKVTSATDTNSSSNSTEGIRRSPRLAKKTT
jgi:hypothetical protein